MKLKHFYLRLTPLGKIHYSEWMRGKAGDFNYHVLAAILAGLILGACSQAGNNANSFGVVWVGPGTSATLTINAQTNTTPAPVPVVPVVPVPLSVAPK
jgi:hypothetical protein